MVRVSKFHLPLIDSLTCHPSIQIYMAPKTPIIFPTWARVVSKIYKTFLGCVKHTNFFEKVDNTQKKNH